MSNKYSQYISNLNKLFLIQIYLSSIENYYDDELVEHNSFGSSNKTYDDYLTEDDLIHLIFIIDKIGKHWKIFQD